MMTECMRWLYDHYILPQIEGKPMDDGDAFRAALFWDALDQEQARTPGRPGLLRSPGVPAGGKDRPGPGPGAGG